MPRRTANVLMNLLVLVHKRFIKLSIVPGGQIDRIEAPDRSLQLLHFQRDQVRGESCAAKAKLSSRIGHFAKVMTDVPPDELPK